MFAFHHEKSLIFSEMKLLKIKSIIILKISNSKERNTVFIAFIYFIFCIYPSVKIDFIYMCLLTCPWDTAKDTIMLPSTSINTNISCSHLLIK